ncbi:MAG: hypothetical protein KF767_05655 [Bdellovibrionaceae bacterium]|nr:hypothetical protein [Pseudobdellovibrionaceae bacterium]
MFAKLLVLFILAFALPAFAEEPACYQNEIDPATRKLYRDEAPYQADLEALLASEPTRPGMYTLYRAYNLSKAETPNANALKNDKRAHCYIGCRLANDISVEAAEYAAWYKEHRDLTDCQKASRFEPQDILATQVGIRLGEQNVPHADKAFCQRTCRQSVR